MVSLEDPPHIEIELMPASHTDLLTLENGNGLFTVCTTTQRKESVDLSFTDI